MPDSKKIRIVVVGAGIIGASIAYNLSRRPGVSVIILDRDSPGSGASGHSFAWINSFGKNPIAYHNLNCQSMDLWHRFTRGFSKDVGLHCGGQLRWENTDEGAEGIHRRVNQLQGWGYSCRLITADEMRQFEPNLSPGIVTAACFSEADAVVEPRQVIDACLARASEHGSVLYTQTPVTHICLGTYGGEKHLATSVKTPHGDIDCDIVVLASGVQTTQLAEMAGVTIPQQTRPGIVVRTNRYPRVLHTVAVIRAPDLNQHDQKIHLRQASDGTLLLGQDTQKHLNRHNSHVHADQLLLQAKHYLPAIFDARAEPVPVAHRPMPADGLPVIGFAKSVPNLYIGLMHSGITLAPLVGKLATLEILDGARVEILNPYRPDRFGHISSS